MNHKFLDFPFFNEAGEFYSIQLTQNINEVSENDIPAVRPIEYLTILKINKTFKFIGCQRSGKT